MVSNNELQKVKKARPAKIGKYTRRVVFFSIFFTWLGTACGVLLSYKISYADIGFDIILSLIAGGAFIGFCIGNFFSKHFKHNTELFFSASNISFIPLVILYIADVLQNIFKDNWTEDIILFNSRIAVIVFSPIVMYVFLRKVIYCCENCKTGYTSITVFASKIASPYKVLFLLQNKQEFPNVSDLEEDDSFPKYNKDYIQVEVTANCCPQCYDAIVNGGLTYEVGTFGKKTKTLLFYSDFWTGELFKKVFHIENNSIQKKEVETVPHRKPSKQMTSIECHYSKIKLVKALLLSIIVLAFLGNGLSEVIKVASEFPSTWIYLKITRIVDEGISLEVFFKMLALTFMALSVILVFCGGTLFFIFSFLRVFDNKPKVIINNIGIEWTKLKMGVIYWQDIEKISLVSEFICITLSEPEKYFHKLSKFRKIALNTNKKRQYGYGDIPIGLMQLEPSANEVWECISQLCESKHYIRNNANPHEYIKSESSK